MVGARLANLENGQTKRAGSIGPASMEDTARQLNVSRKSVVRAKAVLKAGSRELIAAVESGKVAGSAAARIAKETPNRKHQPEAIKQHLEASARASHALRAPVRLAVVCECCQIVVSTEGGCAIAFDRFCRRACRPP